MQSEFIEVGNNFLRIKDIQRIIFHPSRRITSLKESTVTVKPNVLKRLFGKTDTIVKYRHPIYNGSFVSSIDEWRQKTKNEFYGYILDENDVLYRPPSVEILLDAKNTIEEFKPLDYTKEDFRKEYKTIID